MRVPNSAGAAFWGFTVWCVKFRVRGSGSSMWVSDVMTKCPGFTIKGLGLGVKGSGFRVQGSGFMVQGSGCRVKGVGCRVQGLGFRV